MSAEIQPADPRLRVRFLVLMTVVAVLGAGAILWLNAYLVELQALGPRLQPLAAERALRAARTFLALLFTGASCFSLYLGRISLRTLTSGRFPPPGHRVISDTRIRRGRPARRRGQAGLALAASALLLTAAIAWKANRLFERLLDSRLKPTVLQPVEEPRQPTPSRRP